MGHEGDGVPVHGTELGVTEPPAGFVSCDETIERLYTYLDGELTEQRRIEIANRCQDYVPDALRERVAQALREESATGAE
jgi:hypothetical protein